ncbi:MAG: small nuclear ribonucleoprotein (Sm) [Candidatus Altiarchaeales archaeon]|nr:MAG: small nuclear ribonucleoprotein (Sm) [Candidatus Altiarchaeales archaeon]
MILTPSKRYNSEMASLLNKVISVRTINGRTFTGTLLGYDTNQDVVLKEAEDDKGEKYARVFIMKHVISEIYTKVPPLDLEGFAKRLEKVFPRMVKYYPEARAIMVMDRIRITDEGVEGTGPMAERIKKLFEEFRKEQSLTQANQ